MVLGGTEVSEAGKAPFLKVENRADQPLLLLDGEELVGAGQKNRILNTTALVAADTEVTISVTCVEQGRWGLARPPIPPGRCVVLRADQAGVWDDVACLASELEVE